MAPKEHKRPKQQTELEMRRQARDAKRRKAQQQKRMMLLRLLMVAVVVVLAFLLITKLTGSSGSDETQTTPPETIQQQPAVQPQEATTVIHIMAAGDLNVTDNVIANAKTDSGYDFSQTFLDVAPLLSSADLTILNFEGNLSSTEYGTDTGAAPIELVQTLKDIGVDIVQTANSASIREGVLGLQATLDAFDEIGLETLGTYRDSTEFRRSGGYKIAEIQGVRVALVAFTKGMDNLGLPEGSEDCVNLLYTDYKTDYKTVDTEGINSILKRIAEEQPDITIAMVHWGSEYNEEISATQKTIRNLLLGGGVDVIVGTHPHLVKTVDFDESAGTVVAYSLGDFFGDAAMAGSNYSILLDIEVTKDNTTGVTKVTGCETIPIYTLQDDQSTIGGHRVVRIEEALLRYESGYVGAITAGAYDSMLYSLSRIEARIAEEVN